MHKPTARGCTTRTRTPILVAARPSSNALDVPASGASPYAPRTPNGGF